MKKEEIFEFLELQQNAGENDIRKKLNEKMKYFSQLLDNAPTEFIKKVHQNNIQKIQEIHQLVFHTPYNKANTSPTSSVAYPYVEKSKPVENVRKNQEVRSGSYDEDDNAVAWLICHTENKPPHTYSLHKGKNIIGRKSSSTNAGVIAIDDNFISRKHAVIECGNSFLVYDIGEIEGKPSTNGIFLNANPVRIHKKMQLRENDTVQIGLTKLVFKINHQGNLKEITDEIEQSAYLKTVVIDL